MSKALDFKLGDTVEWWSIFSTKQGRIIAVVPAGDVPSDVGMKVDGAGTPRTHKSYVVSAMTIQNTNRGGRIGKRGVYWPRVSVLKPADVSA